MNFHVQLQILERCSFVTTNLTLNIQRRLEMDLQMLLHVFNKRATRLTLLLFHLHVSMLNVTI